MWYGVYECVVYVMWCVCVCVWFVWCVWGYVVCVMWCVCVVNVV